MNQKYILGLDIGIGSVGAALLGCEKKGHTNSFVGLHVRTFDKAETAKEGESLNKIRRDSRLMRRTIRRRKQRKKKLRSLLKRTGLIHSTDPALIRTKKSPWQLRSEALDRQLNNLELAVIIYHIIGHRNFQSNRKSEAKNSETGKILDNINDNTRRMELGKYRSIGEMVWKDSFFAEAKRNKKDEYRATFARKEIENELALIFEQQRSFGNNKATQELEDCVHELLMERRPALAGDALLQMVGKCTFEPSEYRAPKACYTTERFLWLTKLNNLRIAGLGTQRGVTREEHQKLINLPYKNKKLTYKKVRKAIDLEEAEKFTGLDYSGEKDPEKKTLFESKAYHALKDAYKRSDLESEWERDRQRPDRLDLLGYAQTVFKEDVEAQSWLQEKGVEDAVIEAILHVSFSQFISLSLKSLYKIVPEMEQGLRFDEAATQVYGHHSKTKPENKRKYLPRFNEDEIRNPVVFRSLNQARKLVNAIVREYGSPMAVHIELARDLNKSFDERQKIAKGQEAFRKRKEKDIKDFNETFGFIPNGIELHKWRLYSEQFGQSAYSLKPFDLNRLFEVGYAEIDHVLPYSRSFDNSMNNKVLVFTSENREKGNKTPYEYLNGSENSESWRYFTAAVAGNPNYRLAKRQRLLRKNFNTEESKEFTARNLTDTRYACKKFKQHIEQYLQLHEASEAKQCLVVSGSMTGFLRARWGLLKAREKGDLHHALDAAVVAACTAGMIKRVADYSHRNELKDIRKDFVDPETGEILDMELLQTVEKNFPVPWTTFREELHARLSPDPAVYLPELKGVAPIRVSRAPKRRGTGLAHKETIRSAKRIAEQKSSLRTPLTDLKYKDIEKIAGFDDPRNKELILAIQRRLEEHGDNGEKAFATPLYKPCRPGKEKQAPIVRSVRLLTTQKSGIPVRGGIADNGSILRVDIYQEKDRYYAVPLYVSDMVKPTLPNRAVARGADEHNWPVMQPQNFLFSLYSNDWVRVIQFNNVIKEGYFGGIDRSTATINLWSHDRNPKVGSKGLIRGIGIKTAKSYEKFHVDMLGRLHKVFSEKLQPLR